MFDVRESQLLSRKPPLSSGWFMTEKHLESGMFFANIVSQTVSVNPFTFFSS